MRLESIHLRDYKRFTDLRIEELPKSARLVILTGPNGSGKSSLFDALLFKANNEPRVHNPHLGDELQKYYYKTQEEVEQRRAGQNLWNQIDVQFHDGQPASGSWASAFNIRSPYRNEPEFTVSGVSRVEPAHTSRRFERIIDPDQAVSDNYRRLTWKRLTDLDSDAADDMTFGQYRTTAIRELQEAIRTLFPNLQLQDFGGVTGGGGFRFSKGAANDFPYKNLSGGEKAAFDLLLDIFVKRGEYKDAIYCIDEPEAHAAVAIQGKLLEALLSLLPAKSQLWIATHSIGFVRAAYRMAQRGDEVIFLDFAADDFDEAVVLTPSPAGRNFWRRTYHVALDDLAALVGPSRIILCEGNRERPPEGFDAQCYSKIFEGTHGDTMFLSRGGSTQVERTEDLAAVIEALLEGVEILRLIDRDDMTDEVRTIRLENDNMRILSRREIENFLYDPAVLTTFFRLHGYSELPASIEELLPDPAHGDMRQVNREVLNKARQMLPRMHLGNDRKEFALVHLAPALRNTPEVFHKLEEDVFGLPERTEQVVIRDNQV